MRCFGQPSFPASIRILLLSDTRPCYQPVSDWSTSLEEAIRSYQTALLLEPTNRLAKLYLGRCLENVDAPEKLEEGRSYLRELAESPVHDHTTFEAMTGLAWSYRNEDDAAAEQWFRKAALLVTNNDQLTKGSLLFEAEDIADEIASRNRPNPTRAE